MEMYTVEGVLKTDSNKNTDVMPYSPKNSGEPGDGQYKNKFDSLVIRKSERTGN